MKKNASFIFLNIFKYLGIAIFVLFFISSCKQIAYNDNKTDQNFVFRADCGSYFNGFNETLDSMKQQIQECDKIDHTYFRDSIGNAWSLCVTSLVLARNLSPDICNIIPGKYDKYDCQLSGIYHLKSPKACDCISDLQIRKTCFASIAKKTNNKSICKFISDNIDPITLMTDQDLCINDTEIIETNRKIYANFFNLKGGGLAPCNYLCAHDYNFSMWNCVHAPYNDSFDLIWPACSPESKRGLYCGNVVSRKTKCISEFAMIRNDSNICQRMKSDSKDYCLDKFNEFQKELNMLYPCPKDRPICTGNFI